MKQKTALPDSVDLQNQSQTHSVVRALELLEAFPEYGPEIGLTEIARLLQMSKATAYRLLSTLEGRGYVARVPENRRYRLGVRVFELGSFFQNQIEVRRVALPHMKAMVEQTREAAFLCVREGDEALCVERVEAPHEVNIFTLRVGGRQPLHCGGAPRALMAGMSDEDIEGYARRTGLPAITHNTLNSLERLIQDVRQTRERGCVLSTDDVVIGISALGAPIYDHSGKVIASISLSGLTTRFEGERIEELAGILLATAEKLSQQIGGHNGR
jgi:DNA-binding IclR family transcriptional regulator